MGFFEQQDRARRATARLVVLYAIAVALIVASANLVVVPVYVLLTGNAASPAVYAVVSLATAAIIALGSVEIMARLSIGEGDLALMLAGRRVARSSAIDAEQRLINVVDEMAIASGLAAPPAYVLSGEPGINAFAVGRSPNQAIVVVTRGALQELSRDELQAVVAHEFSHILNGDIRLNLRAACALQGIVFLAAIGRFMMQYFSGYGTEGRNRFLHPPFALVGAGLFAIGSVGLVAARLIQSAIAREREFLADACAVQYTRNPDGLCGALARIKLHRDGSRMLNWHADSLAHMLFAPPSLRAWFATHPPIETRMRRANPRVSPSVYFEKQRKPAPAPVRPAEKAAASPAPKTIVPTRITAVSALVASIGEPSGATLEYAGALLAYLPASIREALGDGEGAQAVMVGCILDAEPTARGRQLRALEALGRQALARKSEVLAPLIAQLDRAYRLPLLALALPVLRTELDAAGRGAFLAAMRAGIEADSRMTLGEFVLDTILDWNLGPKAARAGGVRYHRRDELRDECALILSLLAHAGGSQALFSKVAPGLPLVGRDSLQLSKVTQALERLSQLAPLEKQPFIGACAELIAADGNVRLLEHELLRAIAAALDCPMPPSVAALDPRLLRR